MVKWPWSRVHGSDGSADPSPRNATSRSPRGDRCRRASRTQPVQDQLHRVRQDTAHGWRRASSGCTPERLGLGEARTELDFRDVGAGRRGACFAARSSTTSRASTVPKRIKMSLGYRSPAEYEKIGVHHVHGSGGKTSDTGTSEKSVSFGAGGHRNGRTFAAVRHAGR